MQYRTPSSNILFVKVSVKNKPYSTEPVSIRIAADNSQNFNTNRAIFYTELPLKNTTLQQVQAAIQRFMLQNNNSSVVVKMQPKVLQILQQPL